MSTSGNGKDHLAQRNKPRAVRRQGKSRDAHADDVAVQCCFTESRKDELGVLGISEPFGLF